MKPIRIGQIGVGHAHASEKMAALRRLPELYEVVGVAEESEPYPRSSEPYEGVKRMTVDELLDTPGLQAVAVETNMPRACADRHAVHAARPAHAHGQARRRNAGAFPAVGRWLQGAVLAIQSGYMYRSNPAIGFCFRALREGWLGDVFQLDAVMSRYDGDRYRRFMADYPGGAMYIFGSHLIDLAIAMLGRPENVVSFQRATRDDGFNDNGLAVLEYPRATATIRSCVAEADGMKHRRLVVCGTKGTVEVCPLE
jgi:predicted dehydrogenase